MNIVTNPIFTYYNWHLLLDSIGRSEKYYWQF